jgi:hypothetical protein
VTVHNAGPKASSQALVLVTVHGVKITATSDQPAGTPPDQLTDRITRVHIPNLAVGEDWTVDFDVRYTGTGVPPAAEIEAVGGLQPDFNMVNSTTQSLFRR